MKTLLKSSIQSRRGWPALMVLLALLCRPASAQTVMITSNNFYSQLTLDLASPGVITNFATNASVTLSPGETFNISHNITIDGGTNLVVFDGGGVARMFHVTNNVQLTLKNVQVINCASAINGGAIYNQGTLIISNCIISGNTATNITGTNGSGTDSNGDGNSGTSGGTSEGGAIYSTGPVSIYYSVLGTNSANGGNGGSGSAGDIVYEFGGNGGNGGAGGGAYGAAVFSTGSSNVFFATEFIDNVCTAGAGGSGGAAGGGQFPGTGGQAAAGGWVAGGAVFVSGALFMSNCVFSQNTITAGASGSDGSGNNAPSGGTAEGGGLFISTLVTNAYVENCVFFDNTCTGGGGGSSTGDATGGNGGSALGGGLASGALLTRVRNCTLATNSLTAGTNGTGGAGPGSNGSAAGFDIYRGPGVVDLSDSILSGGTNAVANSTPTDPNAYGVTDAGYNISSDTSLTRASTNTLTRTNALLNGFDNNLGGPTLGPEAVGGTELSCLNLESSSPAIDFIPGVPGLTFPATDELGNARGSPTSAGAYEINPITLNTSAPPPSITLEPTNQYTGGGGKVIFTMNAASNDPTNRNVGFQWRFNGTNLSDNGTYSGTATSNLTVKNVTAAQQGTNYQVVVSVNLLEGATTSSAARLVITNPPKFTLQPSGKTALYGSVVTFDVAATGAVPSYQWFTNGVALTDTNEFSGATTSNLTINPVTYANQSNSFTVIVSNAYGAITSAPPAVLKVEADTAKPTVAFANSPAAGARTNNLVVTGTATDGAQVTNVYYWITNVNAGKITITSGSASLGAGTTTKTWAISNVFSPGTNFVTVQSVNYSGSNSLRVTREFFYVVPALFTLNPYSNGTVTGSASVAGNLPTNGALLNIGQGYKLTAHPGNNYVLTNWTGSWSNGLYTFTSNALTLPFVMETNETITATFTTNLLNGAKGTYNGLFYGSNAMDISNVTEQTAGMLYNLMVNPSGSYSGKLLLNGASLTLAAGSFNNSGSATNRVPRAAAQGGPVTVEMNLQWTSGQISGTVSGTNGVGWSSGLYAEKATTETLSNEYTVLLAPGTNSQTAIPPGFGYILITNHNGSVNLSSGALADGSTFNQTVPLGTNNEAPVYYGKLYSGTGLLIGWLGLSNGTVLAETPMVWIKPNAFTNPLEPFMGTLAITNTNSSLALAFDVSITNNTVLKETNSPSTNSLTGTIAPTTGLLKITFGNENAPGATVGYGVILQDTTNGAGYFTNGGLFLLTPR